MLFLLRVAIHGFVNFYLISLNLIKVRKLSHKNIEIDQRNLHVAVRFVTGCKEEDVLEIVREILEHVFNPS